MTELGPIFGFTKYDSSNADQSTLLKMDVFVNAAEYHRYNDKVDKSGFTNLFARAFYTPREPRFITTYDGGMNENPFETAQIQCHEATHQLVHLYTWDLTRKALNREVKWEDCNVRPMWSEEGFAEFFSSFRMDGAKRKWMQPLVERLFEVYVFDEILRAKKWRPFELKEFLQITHAPQLQDAGETRAGTAGQAERKLAGDVVANLFYGKAWSFYYFLWYAEEGGKPKYRDKFIEYLKLEFHLRYAYDKFRKKEDTTPVSTNDFRRVMGVTDDAALGKLDKDWSAFEAKLVEQYKQPQWDVAKKSIRKNLGVDK